MHLYTYVVFVCISKWHFKFYDNISLYWWFKQKAFLYEPEILHTHIRLEFNKGDVVRLMMVMSLGHDGYMHMKEISNLNHLCFNIFFAYPIYKV